VTTGADNFWQSEMKFMEFMKKKSVVLILMLAATWTSAQTTNLTSLLQQGLLEEQANRNLDAAIANYQTLAAQFDQDRQLAATAVFRIGECYRMQGKTNEAAAQYQRVLHDFADQTTLATLSRQNLTGMGMDAAPSTNGMTRQKELLGEEIKVVEQQLAAQQEQIKIGVLQSDGALPTQRQLLELKRQLAALDSGQTMGISDSNNSTDEEDQEIRRIQQMIQNSPDLINAAAPDNGNTPLQKAAYAGWLKVATYLLDHGADVNVGGISALNQAARSGNRAMAELLLSRGADVNSKGELGKTPLHTATEKGFQAVMEVLLANKADVNAVDTFGDTPLHLAAQNGVPQIISLLLAHKAEANTADESGATPLIKAIAANYLENAKLLLAAGANPDVETSSDRLNGAMDPDFYERTPLSFAAGNNSPEMVKLLLDAKADPNGGTLNAPLLVAIHKKDSASAELLLQAGANPNAKERFDWQGGNQGRTTPLYLAVATKQFPLVQLLLKFKADPNGSSIGERSLLFSALSDTNILEALLDAGANVDARDFTAKTGDQRILNWTPLIFAIENYYQPSAEVVEILLKHGANPNLHDEVFGQTPLHWSVGRGSSQLPNRKILEMLFNYKADPNVRNFGGQTPLDLLKRLPTRNDFSPEQKIVAGQLADFLRQHGALDKLPDWDRITVSRPAANFSQTVFSKGTNDWNQVSLLDVLGVQYDLITASDVARYAARPYNRSDFAIHNSFSFPDFSNVMIHRPSADGKNWETRKINLEHSLDSGDCSADVLLQWGDVVEIPEADHVINQQWQGLTTNQLTTLKTALPVICKLPSMGRRQTLLYHRSWRLCLAVTLVRIQT
jgi:ankyrin repeat protein